MELASPGCTSCAARCWADGALPEPQQRGLSVALGLESREGDGPDLFLVAMATLSLMAEAAEEQPLLCVVDDAQWLDQASAQVLGFVGRRLLAEPIALVFADPAIRRWLTPGSAGGSARAAPGRAGEGGGPGAAGHRASGPLDEGVRRRIVEETHGNPLALLEFGRGPGRGRLAGGFALPDAGDFPGRIEDQYVERLGTLPPRRAAAAPAGRRRPGGDAALILGRRSGRPGPACSRRRPRPACSRSARTSASGTPSCARRSTGPPRAGPASGPRGAGRGDRSAGRP